MTPSISIRAFLGTIVNEVEDAATSLSPRRLIEKTRQVLSSLNPSRIQGRIQEEMMVATFNTYVQIAEITEDAPNQECRMGTCQRSCCQDFRGFTAPGDSATDGQTADIIEELRPKV